MDKTQGMILKNSLSGPSGITFPVLYCCEDMPQYNTEKFGLEQISEYLITPWLGHVIFVIVYTK